MSPTRSAATTALVTGSDGFLGSRVAARLRERGVAVRSLVRRGLLASAAAQNGAGPASVERVRGDVTDVPALERATAGCGVVFHCAYGGMTLKESRLINVDGTRNVIEAAARAGITRVIHVSTMAVHGYVLPEVLTETFPMAMKSDAYAISKAEGERVAFETGARLGVEVVAVRPTLVYGPRAPYWVVSYFERTKNEQVALIDGGRGLANLVWVDDVVDAMFAAWERPDVAGEAYLISGSQPVSWREYLGRFARMCNKPVPPSVSGIGAKVQAPFLRVLGALTQRPRRLSGMDMTLMPQRCHVSIAKAERDLGYAPKVSFDDGMDRCEAWLRGEGYLPPLATEVRAA